MSKDSLKDYLTEVELSKINQFLSDEAMYDAVKKVLLAAVYYNGVLIKGEQFEARNQAFDLISKAYQNGETVSNELLGQELRGLFEGVNALEQGFSRLKLMKEPEKKLKVDINNAI